MPVTPPAARHTVEDLGDRLKIAIPSRRQWLQTLFLGFWLMGWAFGEISVLGRFFRSFQQRQRELAGRDESWRAVERTRQAHQIQQAFVHLGQG